MLANIPIFLRVNVRAFRSRLRELLWGICHFRTVCSLYYAFLALQYRRMLFFLYFFFTVQCDFRACFQAIFFLINLVLVSAASSLVVAGCLVTRKALASGPSHNTFNYFAPLYLSRDQAVPGSCMHAYERSRKYLA